MSKTELRRRASRVVPRKLAPLAAVTALLLFAMSSALAINPATFEMDGNAVDNAAVAGDDWGTMFPTGNGSQLSKSFVDDDAAIDETYFTGGSSKDDINIDTTIVPDGGWLYDESSSAQPKADIIDAFAAAYVDTSFTPSHRVVYFGADRYSNDGATFMGFWFLKDGVTFGDPANNGVGEIHGTHTDGDILVLTDFTQGGPVVNFAIFKWVAGGGTDGATNLERIFTGQDCSISLTVNACSTVNGSDTPSPWTFVPKPNVGDPGNFEPGLFIEGVIDLTALFPGSDGCFSAFVAETRASFSVSSTLSDFTYGEFNTCGGIEATKYHDLNANGSRDADGVDNIAGNADDEVPLSGWTIFIDKNADEIHDADGVDNIAGNSDDEISGVTGTDGKVTFSNLTSGNFSVCEVLQANWLNSDPTGTTLCETAAVGTGGAVASVDYGNYQNVSFKLTKYHDLNANGSRDGGEPGLLNWQFYQENGANEVRDAATDGALVSTDANGDVTVTVAPGGPYKFCEVLQASWINSDPAGATICESTGTIVSGGSQSDLVYGNYQNVSVKAIKYHDKNADGVRDADGVDDILGGLGAGDDEVVLSGWVFFVDGNGNETMDAGAETTGSQTTNANGEATFSLTPGASYSICEVLQANWVNTDPAGVTLCESTGTLVSGTPAADRIFGNHPQYRLIVLTCNEATGTLVVSTVDLDGAGATYPAKDTIGTPPALGTESVSALQAYLCNLGGAQYNDLNPQTFSSISAILPRYN